MDLGKRTDATNRHYDTSPISSDCDASVTHFQSSAHEYDADLRARMAHRSHHRCRGGGDGLALARDDRHRVTINTSRNSDVESLSSIPPASVGSVDVPPETKRVYSELCDISSKLKTELGLLNKREMALKEKEAFLVETHASLERCIAAEVQSRLSERDQEIEKLKDQIREKTKENKRMKDNFDTLKMANDTLHRELESLKQAHDKLYKQHCSLQARITNLQRKQEYAERKSVPESVQTDLLKTKQPLTSVCQPSLNSKIKPKPPKIVPASAYDMLSVLLEWVTEMSLQPNGTDGRSQQAIGLESSSMYIPDKCLRILPHCLDVTREMSTRGTGNVLPCLQFIYWSLIHLEVIRQGHQRATLPSTMRRLGEELYSSKPQQLSSSVQESDVCSDDSSRDRLFLHSPDLHVRFLSTLIILKTINQVDHVAHVFEVLQSDLRLENCRQLFVHYNAVSVILSYIRPANKTLTNAAVDVMLQMSVDSLSVRPSFISHCSVANVAAEFFQKLALLWRTTAADVQLLEKVSILLQKSSKIKSNWKYFDMYGISAQCPEILRTYGSESPFLALNIKSVLLILNAAK